MFPNEYKRRKRIESSWAGTLDTFHSLVHRAGDADGCWLFMGPKEAGYGIIRYGNAAGRTAKLYAHDIAMAEHLGRFLGPFEFVVHRCRHQACVNPDHLYICADGAEPEAQPDIPGSDLTHERKTMPGNRRITDDQAKQVIELFFGDQGSGAVARVTPGVIQWTINSLCDRFNVNRPAMRRVLFDGSNSSPLLSEPQVQEARQLFNGPQGVGSISLPRTESARWRAFVIAKRLELSSRNVLKIVRGKSFTHLPRPDHAHLYVMDMLPIDIELSGYTPARLSKAAEEADYATVSDEDPGEPEDDSGDCDG